MHKYTGELALILTTILAALGWFFSKYAIAGFPPLGFLGVRFFLAALLFLPIAYRPLLQLSKPQLFSAISVGMAFAVFLSSWILAIHHDTNLGNGAFLLSLSMLIAPLLSRLIFKHALEKIFWLAFPLSLCGLYFLAVGNDGLHLSNESWFYLLAAFLSALYFVLNNKYAKDIPILPLTTIQLAVIGILCSLFSLCGENWNQTIPISTWGWLAASILISTNLRYLLQTFGQKHCNIANASIIMLFEPIWTLILSVILFSEELGFRKLLGCGLILLSLMVYRLLGVKQKY